MRVWLQVSTGVTLRENNLKEIEGGKILESQGVLVANRRALKRDARLLKVVHELIERFEVRLRIFSCIRRSAGDTHFSHTMCKSKALAVEMDVG